MSEMPLTPLSESIQMYLVTIARLQVDDRPVPLSQLAEDLSISPVSVNEMCRKLQDQELVIYRPYKGASLTQEGGRQANYILRRHRLWEVFVVDKLGFDYDQAHDIACQLEHSTSKLLADRLNVFLDYPAVNPQGEPIPRADASLARRESLPLSGLSTGQGGHVIRCDASEAASAFLYEQGVRPGATFAVVATAGDSLLVQVDGAYISLARPLAEEIQVELSENKTIAEDVIERSILDKEKSEMPEITNDQIPLHKLKKGQNAIVVHVGGKGAAKRRMMDMGLVPGSEVKVVRVAPLGDPIEFTVKGYSLSLRKSEASNIKVEISE
ncbi:MAG: metal-dependent transcriptional regulator [Chloroflexota bacterium]|nr:metal-dependent transcriptional regulator [Chloroflexota bacterium]